MNIELKPIAESKVRQLGGDVCGVLVRTEAGAWAAVSEGGRVMWLDDFEGQPARAQGGQEVEPFAVITNADKFMSEGVGTAYKTSMVPIRAGDVALYTQPQPAQQGSVPEGWKLVPVEPTREMRRAFHEAHELFEDGEEIGGSPDDEWRAMLDAAPTAPQPQADGWIRCEDRLPTYRDSDEYGDVRVMSKLYGVKKMAWSSVRADFESHWKPTDLKRPQPPQEQ